MNTLNNLTKSMMADFVIIRICSLSQIDVITHKHEQEC